MKKIIFALAVTAGGFGWLHVLRERNPEVIANPVYAEVRVDADAPEVRSSVILWPASIQDTCTDRQSVV